MNIPVKYNPQEIEKKIFQKWIKAGDFNAEVNKGKPPFCIVIPPPNVTGVLHMGHALNNTLQDVLIRFKRMQGYETLWIPGTDHAGIATQNVVEKSLAKDGLKKENLGREKFIEHLWEWTHKHGSTIIEQLKKLGASCDFRRIRFTKDKQYSDAVNEVFIRLYKKGLIYKGNYIVNWCPRCRTALSDEEAPHREIDGLLYYIKYPVVGKKSQADDCPEYILVATTRPETMLGDTAVAVNPHDKRYKFLKEAVVILPIVERELKVIEDDAVDPDFGTGVVKVTPAHDPVDFQLGKKHNLEFINIMNEDATLNKNVPAEFSGMDRFKAREALLTLLEEKKLIDKKEPYKVSAGHCYRCHVLIEPRVSAQWFVKMKPLAEKAIEAVEKDLIKFYPQRWKKVYLNWMYNIQDWCISRQIWWGHRIPVYYCNKCSKIIVSEAQPEKCPDCNALEFTREEDVLDTWFSSWLWPFATFYWPFGNVDDREKKSEELDYFYPTKVLVTASEILFFWVARMIMAGFEFKGNIPFNNVLIHGTVRDDTGTKMSKSLGNVIDPLEIIDKFGADSLRFSLMLLAAGGSDVYLSDEKFLVGRNFCNKLWNAARFVFIKIEENNINIENLNIETVDIIDSWILKKLNTAIEDITVNLETYRINEATKSMYDFFWHNFCDWYLEIVKDSFDTNKAKILVLSLINSIKLLHPVIPFITEEIWELIKNHTSLKTDNDLACSSWPAVWENIDETAVNTTEILLNTVREIRNIRSALGLTTQKITLEVKTNNSEKELLLNNRTWLQRLASLGGIEFKNELQRVLYKDTMWELNLDIETDDMGNFLSSLDKKIENLKNTGEKTGGRLKNEKFLQNAAEEIVEKEKIKFEDISRQIKRMEELRNAFALKK